MRLRWQLGLGGGLLALAVVAVAHAYVDPAAAGRNRLTDPLFLALAFALGAGAGLLAGAALARPVDALAGAARGLAAHGAEPWPALAGTPAFELVELHRALRDLRARQGVVLAQLRAEMARLDVILDSVAEGLLVTGPDGRVLLANRALRDLFGLTRPAVGRSPVEVVRHSAVGAAIDRVLAGQGPVACQVEIGGGRSLDVRVTPIGSAAEHAGTVTVFYEITRLRRLERIREDFVANVSHELRTPLTAIKGCAETLADGALADPRAAARFVAVISNHADRLTTLLTDLLDLARLESDEARVGWAEVPARHLADTALEAVAKLARDKAIAIDVEIPEGLRVPCDRKLIEQALINLLDNAVKYTPTPGRVRLSARQLSRRELVPELARRRFSTGAGQTAPEGAPKGEAGAMAAVFEVADGGIGIPADEIERVFERFYRVDKGRSRALGGTGLGLSIVRHVVQLHGEGVFVDSDLGRGSVFGFTLPAA